MRDIVSRGSDREPGPWARRGPRLLAAATAVLVAGVLIVTHLPRHHGTPARPGSAPALNQEQISGASAVAGGIPGPTLPWAASARLLVASQQPEWFYPGTGRATPVRGLPRSSSGYQFARTGGGWLIQAGPGTDAPGPVWFLGDQARSATRIGVATRAAPGATAGQVWLTGYQPGADPGPAAGTAQEVSVSGAPLGAPLTLPDGYVIVQGTDRGLLLAPAVPGPGPMDEMLWDPAHPEATRTFSSVVAVSPAYVAWAPQCTPACSVQISDLATGLNEIVALPGASSAASAAFSPDGQFLAIELSFLQTVDNGDQAAQLDVVSLATGRVSVVPSSFVSSDALVGFGWPASGDSLIAELSFTTKVQVASWVPGAGRLAVAAVRPGPDSALLVLG
jgi:hypothetical protein